jgi:putative acetyltransferase
MSLTIIHQGERGRPDVQDLLARYVEAMHVHSLPEACHVLAAEALGDPSIIFFSAREDGWLLAVGALKSLSASEGEVKSMRTADAALRRGAASAILRAVVAEARRRGHQRLLLETGSGEEFAAATALYERAGFVPGDPFGGYPPGLSTRFMALDL